MRVRLAELPDTARVRPDPETAIAALRAGRWSYRLASDAQGEELVELAAQALASLPPPGERVDRRLLAQRLTGFPKALDRGSVLTGLVLALAASAGAVADTGDQRSAWDGIGVDYDQLTGGLLCLNVLPDGWHLPADEPVTVVPHTLARCRWARPPNPQAWVFVTENPSVVTALLDLVPLPCGARLVCTIGTPSAVEVAAIARLAEDGWRIAVRADFDVAGLRHVSAVTAAQPAAAPWRMTAADYRGSLSAGTGRWHYPLDPEHLPPTPWDAALHAAMRRHRRPGYEEGLLTKLLDDVLSGHPPQAAPPLPPERTT